MLPASGLSIYHSHLYFPTLISINRNLIEAALISLDHFNNQSNFFFSILSHSIFFRERSLLYTHMRAIQRLLKITINSLWLLCFGDCQSHHHLKKLNIMRTFLNHFFKKKLLQQFYTSLDSLNDSIVYHEKWPSRMWITPKRKKEEKYFLEC